MCQPILSFPEQNKVDSDEAATRTCLLASDAFGASQTKGKKLSAGTHLLSP